VNTISEDVRTESDGWLISGSRPVMALFLLLVILSIACAGANDLNLLVRSILVVAAFVYGGWSLWRLATPTWKTFAIEDSSLVLVDRQARRVRLEQCHRCFVSPFYIGVSGRDQTTDRRVRLGLFRGQVEQDAYRQLALWLRGLSDL
jgi:hypothetical protein